MKNENALKWMTELQKTKQSRIASEALGSITEMKSSTILILLKAEGISIILDTMKTNRMRWNENEHKSVTGHTSKHRD